MSKKKKADPESETMLPEPPAPPADPELIGEEGRAEMFEPKSKKAEKKPKKEPDPHALAKAKGVKFTKVTVPGVIRVKGETWKKLQKMGVMADAAGRVLDEALAEK